MPSEAAPAVVAALVQAPVVRVPALVRVEVRAPVRVEVRAVLRALPPERPALPQVPPPELRALLPARPVPRRVPLPEPRALPPERPVRPPGRRAAQPASLATRRVAVPAYPSEARRARGWRLPSTWA
jgi:hypothetical protein